MARALGSSRQNLTPLCSPHKGHSPCRAPVQSRGRRKRKRKVFPTCQAPDPLTAHRSCGASPFPLKLGLQNHLWDFRVLPSLGDLPRDILPGLRLWGQGKRGKGLLRPSHLSVSPRGFK